MTMKATPWSTRTVASGRSSRRWSMPPLAEMPPTSTATGGIAERPLDQLVEHRDRDVGQEQARDRLVDAPVVAQGPGEADPGPADRHGARRHRDLHPEGRRAGEEVADDGGGEAPEHERALP